MGGHKTYPILSCLPFTWPHVLGGNSDCGASPWCWSGRVHPGQEGKRNVTLKGTSNWGGAAEELLLQAWELQAGCHLPSPTQTKYPALRVSEKFLASACPGLSGLKSPSFVEPGLLSALSLFFLFLTPGAQADWQTYPSMEGRALALGSSQEEGGSVSQRPRESETV